MNHVTLLAAAVFGLGAYAAGNDSHLGTPAVGTTVTAPADTTSTIGSAPAAIDATRQTGTTAPGTGVTITRTMTPSATTSSGTGGVVTEVTPRTVDTIGPPPQPISPMPLPQ